MGGLQIETLPDEHENDGGARTHESGDRPRREPIEPVEAMRTCCVNDQPRFFNVDLSARSSLNSTSGNQPFSVAVRIYQLKDRKGFDAASYDDLLNDDRSVLAQDLQDMASVVVAPGGAVNVTQPMKPDAEYVAVVAFFRDATASTSWRRVFAKKKLSADDPLKLELVGNDLVAAGDTQKARPAP
ncbi:type VI secretion system lipoprotein TssJ [Paraburkholderia nodosa]|uniref:type VI secretion system lipoprotein TssJ n=1 Tax=Paraburkholderia nodosa TaxID=392320 RepID=UPI000842139A|nr:type VI secretion system lipoprotein TssJ [Paraburkholderia nodosa]